MTEAENRNVRGFDFTTPSPIQAQAQAQFAANPPAGVPLTAAEFARARRLPVLSTMTNRRMWDADKQQLPAALRVHLPARRDRWWSAAASGCSSRRSRSTRVPGLGNPINQFGYSRNTPVPVTSDNGLTFQAEPDQSRAERPAAATESDRASACGQPGRQRRGTVIPTDRTTREYWRYSIGVERQLAAQLAGRDLLPRPERLEPADRRARSTSCRRQYRTQSADSRRDGRDVPQPGRVESVPGTDAGQPRRQRRDHRAAPAAAAGSAVRHAERRGVRGDEHLSRACCRAGQALHGRVHGADARTRGRACARRRRRSTRGRISKSRVGRRRSAAPRHARQRRRAAVRPGAAAGAATGTRALDAVLGGWQFSARYEWQSGVPLAFSQTRTSIPAAAIRRDLKSQWGKNRQRPGLRRRHPGLRHELLLHPERPAVPQRGRTGRDIPGDGDRAGPGQHPDVPDDAAGRAVPGASPAGHRD